MNLYTIEAPIAKRAKPTLSKSIEFFRLIVIWLLSLYVLYNAFFYLSIAKKMEFQKAEKVYFHDKLLATSILKIFPDFIKPNHITLFRFAATPVVALLLVLDYYSLAFVSFMLVAFSDALDGSMARSKDQITEWGKVYDPLADKVLIATMIFLIVLKELGFWVSVVIIALEIVIIIAAWIRKHEGGVVQANWFGKTKMILQVFGVSFLMLSAILGLSEVLPYISGMFYLAIVFAVISLLTHGV